MMRAIEVEAGKLVGSLAALIIVAVPALLSTIVLLAMISNPHSPTWRTVFYDFAFPVWSFFLLPMAIAALTTLLGNIEHRSGMWDHWLSLPVARWQIYAAKAVIALTSVVAMTGLMVLFTLTLVPISGVMGRKVPSGNPDIRSILQTASLIVASSAMLTMFQLWVALRFQNFVVPLAFGISGTFIAIAVAMTATKQADYFPWVLPVRVLIGGHPLQSGMVGLVGGLITSVVMTFALQRTR